jgi:hypothetical protein
LQFFIFFRFYLGYWLQSFFLNFFLLSHLWYLIVNIFLKDYVDIALLYAQAQAFVMSVLSFSVI